MSGPIPAEDWDRHPQRNDLCQHRETGVMVLIVSVNGLDIVCTPTSDSSPIEGPITYSLFQFKRLFRLVRPG